MKNFLKPRGVEPDDNESMKNITEEQINEMITDARKKTALKGYINRIKETEEKMTWEEIDKILDECNEQLKERVYPQESFNMEEYLNSPVREGESIMTDNPRCMY